MSVFSTIEGEISDFVLHKAVGRAVIIVAQAIASYSLAHAGLLQAAGVSVNVDPNVVAGAILGGIHVGAQYLSAKNPRLLGWLAAL